MYAQMSRDLNIKKSGKDYTNEELCNLINTIAEAKDQET